MADRKLLKILGQGAEAWNKWRDKVDDPVPDLRGATIPPVNLSGANLSGANLSLAVLAGSNLSGANLRVADLSYARLIRTNLSNADMSHAGLIGSSLHIVNLSGADFRQATFGVTTLSALDLREVKNLESVQHTVPSSIDIDTIYRSNGDINEKFLRGCGVPEDFITYMKSLTGKAIEFYSCFISYSSKDDEFAKRLYADLQNEGVRCWFAPEDLKIGDKFRMRIDESIKLYDKLLLVLSENSVSSQWVEDEVEAALEKEQVEDKTVLFPVRLDGAVMEVKGGWPAAVRRNRHMGDFSDWKNHDSYKKGFERLMRDLRDEARRQ